MGLLQKYHQADENKKHKNKVLKLAQDALTVLNLLNWGDNVPNLQEGPTD